MIIGYEYDEFVRLRPLTAFQAGDEIYIITRQRNRKRLLDELKKLGYTYHKLCTFKTDKEFNSRDVVRHKRSVIHYYGVQKYYEDNANEARDLKFLCPTCEVILKDFNKQEDVSK